MYVRVNRMYDEQRIHFKEIEDSQRQAYMDNQRAMAAAAASTNLQSLSQKNSKESYLKNMEARQDQTDLAKVNSSTLNASATLAQGTGSFRQY